jgi:hypothetical protein
MLICDLDQFKTLAVARQVIRLTTTTTTTKKNKRKKEEPEPILNLGRLSRVARQVNSIGRCKI